jgi:hypothetical protein
LGLTAPLEEETITSFIANFLRSKLRSIFEGVAKRLENGEPVTLIMDSTGFRFGKASSWYETKYNKPCAQRPWRKFHLSMDEDINMHDVAITETQVSELAIMNYFLTQKDPVLPPYIRSRK